MRSLLGDGHNVRSVDTKALDSWYQVQPDAENVVADLQQRRHAERATDGVERVFNLACDVGGMGFIENNEALCMLSVLINTHLLEASRHAGMERFFFASSACVYAAGRQTDPNVTALVEGDVYPAMPEDGDGWRSSPRSGFVAISAKTSVSRRASPVITTSTDLKERGREKAG